MKLVRYLPKQKRLKPFIVRRVVGKSMLPLFREDAMVWATALYRKLQAGDVVIIGHDNIEKIKRVEAVQDGQLFVLGDNADASTDSRSFGWLPLSSVQAKVIWPKH